LKKKGILELVDIIEFKKHQRKHISSFKKLKSLFNKENKLEGVIIQTIQNILTNPDDDETVKIMGFILFILFTIMTIDHEERIEYISNQIEKYLEKGEREKWYGR